MTAGDLVPSAISPLIAASNLEGFPRQIQMTAREAVAAKSLAVLGAPVSVTTAGQQRSFTIIFRDAFENPSEVGLLELVVMSRMADSEQSHYQYATHTHTGSEVSIDFTATSTGTFALYILLGQAPVAGSPFLFDVRPGFPAHSSCFARGSSVSLLTAGVNAAFTIMSADEHGNPSNSAGALRYCLQLASSDIDACSGTALRFDLGVYEAQIVATVAGSHALVVQLGESHVRGSPYTVRVLPAVSVGSTSSMQGQGISSTTAGLTAEFHVSVRDRFSNHAQSAAPVFASLSPDERGVRNTRVSTEQLGADTYRLRYTATRAGSNTLNTWIVYPHALHATYFASSDLDPESA
eukprot:3161458-Rhodomonas_salina.1